MIERLRGRALQRRRTKWFRAHPLCVRCEAAGRIGCAVELDHVISLEHGGRDDETNLQGLCWDCHQAKTGEDRGYKVKPTIAADGWAEGD